MVGSVLRACMLAVALSVLAAASAMQEPADETAAQPSPPKASPATREKKAKLAEATRVSTDEALRKVAEEKMQGQGTESSAPEGAVVELKPTSPAADDSQEAKTSKQDRDSKLKNVHGSVYGSVDPQETGTRSTGAAVGVSSKSGKVGVYVETERSRQTTPPPR